MNTKAEPGLNSEVVVKGDGNDELFSPLTYSLSMYTGENVHEIWPEIRSFVGRAAEWGRGEFMTSDVLVMATSEKMQVWVFRYGSNVELVCVTEIIQHPRLRVCNIYALAGRRMKDLWRKFFPQVLPWLKQNGIDEVQTTCRDEIAAMIKTLGFQPLVQVLRYDIKDIV